MFTPKQAFKLDYIITYIFDLTCIILFKSITMCSGTESILFYTPHLYYEYEEIFHGLLWVPHNIVRNMNNVMWNPNTFKWLFYPYILSIDFKYRTISQTHDNILLLQHHMIIKLIVHDKFHCPLGTNHYSNKTYKQSQFPNLTWYIFYNTLHKL